MPPYLNEKVQKDRTLLKVYLERIWTIGEDSYINLRTLVLLWMVEVMTWTHYDGRGHEAYDIRMHLVPDFPASRPETLLDYLLPVSVLCGEWVRWKLASMALIAPWYGIWEIAGTG
jgi:hypothetical protein